MADNAQNLSICDPSRYSAVSILYMDTVCTDSRRAARPHRHDFWQLEAGIRGEIKALYEQDSVILEPGGILLLPPGCSHSFSYPGGFVSWITVKFTFPDPVEPIAGLLCSESTEYRAASLLTGLISDSALTGNERRIAAEGLLCTIAGIWASRYGSLTHPYRNTIDMMLEQRKGKPLTVAEASEEIGCSKAHLSRTFRNLTGVTLKKYIDTTRCSYLVKQLSYTTLSVSEIAFNTGFSDIYTFSRFLRTHTGECPRHLRKKMSD